MEFNTELKKIEKYINSLSNKLEAFMPKEDAKQELTIAFWECYTKYDPSLGASLKTYASARLEGRVLDIMREEYGRYEGAVRYECVDISEYDEVLEDSRNSWEDRVVTGLYVEAMLQRIRSAQQREVIELRLGGYTVEEVAKIEGVSPSRISQIYGKGIKNLRIIARA